MEIKQLNKDKPEGIILQVHSGEASASIPAGTPVILALDGTNDGLDVVLPSSESVLANSALYGITLGVMAAGAYGQVRAFGFVRETVLRQRTRANSTDSFSSVSSLERGHMLAVDTVNNAFSTKSASMAASMFLPKAILAQTLASVASTVSTTANELTVLTTSVKTFVRFM